MKTFEATPDRLLEVSDGLTARNASAGLPDGAYTTFRTYGGTRVLRLEDHVRRLLETARLQGRAGDLDAETVRLAVARAIERTGHAESRVRLTWAPPRLFASIEPFAPPPEEVYRDGAWCATVPLRRDNPRAKDTRFIREAGDAFDHLPPGAHEGLMVAEDGSMLEGLSSNFFAIREGTLYTEEDRVLAGLTRSLVLEIAAGLLPRAPRALRRDELSQAQECFVTSASRGVLPVVRVDQTRIGSGVPGPLTREIRARYESRVAAEAEDVRFPKARPAAAEWAVTMNEGPGGVDLRQVNEERSIEMHRVVARRLEENQALVDAALERIERWMAAGSIHPTYGAAWRQLLSGPIDRLLAVLTEPSDRARALRQCSPFAGTMDARTRWDIWRRARRTG